jgi:alpha-tubulin suppressor-like RCC1 family protein
MCAIKSGRVACWGNALFSGTGFLSQPENVRSEMLVSPRSINSSDSFAMIAAGARHACGLTTTRGIRCWGSNERAALGRGTINGHADPASPSVSGEFVQVSTGLYSSCALDTSARAWCWGSNDYGTAGSPNPPTEMLTPTQVVGGFQWRSVTTGWNHTCGITTADRLHCWGYEYGSVPREIGAGRRWASVSPGGDLLCGITTAAELFCWSVNAAPRIVETKDPVVRVDVGTHHRCTVTVLQQALCWGNGTGGSLGLWTAEVMLPTVGPSGTWRTIDAGEAFESCGVRSDGAVMCWGTNKGGRLGLGYPALPGIRVTTPSKIVQEVRGGGNHHRCLVLQDGSGSCSGWNNSGQLGTLDYAERRPGHDIPFSAVTSTRFLTTALEYDFTYALSTDGIVWGWGGPPIPLTAANYSVRRWKGLWNGGTTSGVPTHRCLLSEQNEAWCEGANLFGELGRGVRGGDRNDLALVSGNRVWRTLALGGRHSCGIDSEGLGWCWGSNKEGQLGDGTTTDRLIPTAIAGGFRWRTLSAAGYGDDGATTCGIRDDGRAYCWGRGPLGNGGVNASSLPLAVTGTTQTWVDIAVGPTHRCGTTSNREVWCWGRNLYGETQPASTALDLNTPTRVTGVAADRVTTLGRAYNTFVWAATCAWSTSTPYLACWGDNHLGLVDPSAEGYRGAFNTPQEVRLP